MKEDHEIDIKTDVLDKLDGHKRSGDGWIAKCPAHKDKHPSLSIGRGSDGKILLNCFAGCEFMDILRALDLYFPEHEQKGFLKDSPRQNSKIKAVYDYTDEEGKLLYQIYRFEPKGFAIARPDGKGGLNWSGKVIKKVLYLLPEVQKARENKEIVILCEGEKDVNNVREKLGFPATTSPFGAGSWKDEYADSLIGLDVVILPDQNDVGRQYAEDAANSLYNRDVIVKVINLPSLSDGEDVTDWIEKGGSREQLLDLISNAKEWTPNNTALVKAQSDLEEVVIDGICADYLIKSPLTDTGNAECFLAEHENQFKYIKTNKQWYQWDGVIWREDKTNVIDDAILKVIRGRRNTFIEEFDNGDADGIGKKIGYLLRCEDVKNRKNIKEAIELLPQFITTIDQYDKDLFLAATKNGTLDLKDGIFRESRQGDYLTLQLGTQHDSSADCPRWKQFLQEIFNDDEEIIDFMQRIAGYCLTGDISEQVMFILYGFGKNGKTVFSSVMAALLGDYAGTASFRTFDADKQSEQSNDLAMLKGKRVVLMSESAADRRLNEPLIKQVTGGDAITCRFLRREFFSYVPQFKLFLATNHKPVITQSDFGIWRRIVLIPFTENFEGREDPNLKDHLFMELPGILNWAIEGLKKWHREGLKNRPKAVIEATSRYKQDSDTVGQWLELNMVTHPDSKIKSSEAYNNYREWAIEDGYFPVGKKTFDPSLEERGFYRKRVSDGVYWHGFGFPFNLE